MWIPCNNCQIRDRTWPDQNLWGLPPASSRSPPLPLLKGNNHCQRLLLPIFELNIHGLYLVYSLVSDIFHSTLWDLSMMLCIVLTHFFSLIYSILLHDSTTVYLFILLVVAFGLFSIFGYYRWCCWIHSCISLSVCVWTCFYWVYDLSRIAGS